MKQTVKVKDETIEKMATASYKLKARLSRFEQELCKFTVEKIFKGYPPSVAQVSTSLPESSQSELCLIQELKTRNAHLHVIVNGKRNTWPIEDINSFAGSKTEMNKFYVIFKVCAVFSLLIIPGQISRSFPI